MELFFFPHLQPGERVVCDPDTAKHIRALRLREGAAVWLTDGRGSRFEGSLRREAGQTVIELTRHEVFSPPFPRLTVAISPTAHPDRLEWFVEKAVELGVDAIQPILCDNTEKEQIRVDRLMRVAVAALRQSQRCWLPVIEPVRPFREWLERVDAPGRFLAHCQPDTTKVFLQEVLRKGEDAAIAIGPEGDFSTDEIYLAGQSGFHAVSLGEARLRTETAGLAAVHTFALINR